MVSKLALAATVGLAAARPAPQNKPLIVGGVEASSGEFPYIVSLQTNSHFCGGSLISSTVVITAGHCSVGFQPSDVRVRAGTTVSLADLAT
jgi:trypsin